MLKRRTFLAGVASGSLATALSFGLSRAHGAQSDAAHDSVARDTQLIMVEQAGCVYCARWDAEVADIYPKTPEGKFAPLRRIDLHEARPTDIAFKSPLVLTPTFVLIQDGVEQARIEGYGGDEMFWSMMTVTLQSHTDFDAQTIE